MGIFDKFKKNKTISQEQGCISDEVLNTLDSSIRPLIKLCNENGIHTYACCSGSMLEHEEEYMSGRGYVAFKDSKEARELISILLNFEDLDVAISSKPKETYEYFDNVIDCETFAVYFRNENGENMQKVYDRFETGIKNREVSKTNLKMINSVIKKFRAQENDFEYLVEFNDFLNMEEVNSKCCVSIRDMYLLDDDKNVGNVKVLAQDISHILNTSDNFSDIGAIFLPSCMGKNALPVLDLIKKQALSQRERYTLSREKARKAYEEVYGEQEFEYLGYEEEHDFEEELDNEFPIVSKEDIFNNIDSRKIEDNDDFTI